MVRSGAHRQRRLEAPDATVERLEAPVDGGGSSPREWIPPPGGPLRMTVWSSESLSHMTALVM